MKLIFALIACIWVADAVAFEQIPGADGCPRAGGCTTGAQYKWALFVASTKDYEYVGMFTSYQQCKDTGIKQAAHFSGDGEPLFQCRLAVKDH